MMDDCDIFRCAEILADQAGEQAESRAAAALEALAAKGDELGVALWGRIIAALTGIRLAARPQGASVH